jgi:hypothetical protein
VLAVACVLHTKGSCTTREIMTALGQVQRDRIDRATTLGRELGLFTRCISTRNLQRFAVVLMPPTRRPVYPARAILATGASKMPPSELGSFPKNGKLSSLASIDIVDIENKSITQGVVEELNAVEQKKIEDAKARRRRRPKPIPVPKEPTPEIAAAVLALANIWASACRNAFGRLKWSSVLRGEKPWMSPNPKQQRRWRAYYRLHMMLQEHQIDPAEYCVAMAAWGASQQIPRVPNAAVLSGECGRNRYWMWKAQLEAKWVGVPNVVRREAAASLADPNDQLAVVLRHAWQQCRQYGTREAISLLWDPEVLWLLHLQEKAAKVVIDELLAQPNSEYAPKVREALRTIWDDPARRCRLTKVWTQTIGPRHTLQEVVVPEGVVEQQTKLRALQAKYAELHAQEKAQFHAESVAAATRSVMAAVRQRQARRRA